MSSHSFFKLSVEVYSTDKGLFCASFDSEAQKPITYCPLYKCINMTFIVWCTARLHDSSSCDQSTWQAMCNLSPPEIPWVGRRRVLKWELTSGLFCKQRSPVTTTWGWLVCSRCHLGSFKKVLKLNFHTAFPQYTWLCKFKLFSPLGVTSFIITGKVSSWSELAVNQSRSR